MCIIIDTNKIHEFFQNPLATDATPINDWLQKGGVAVYCTAGTYGRELENFKTKLKDFRRSGRMILIEGEKVNVEERKLKKANICKSDDVHILALAKASSARLLYTGDNDLKTDFKNKAIINNPRGKIYSGAGNKNLLQSNLCKKII